MPQTLLLLLLIQFLLFLPAFGVAWAVARWCPDLFRQLAAWGRWLARRRTLGIAAVGGLAFVLAMGTSLLRWPVPTVHDEFSYLLAADTFVRGRLSNPPYPMWEHFETFHVIQQPTYASKYPPGQGLVLALGRILSGRPEVGLWLSMGLCAAAICWMLQGWMPGRWALLGGLLVACHAKFQFEWTQGYWGGNLAMIGGALVLGGYPRLVRRCRVRDALAMAAGLAILANSRPFEGLAASLPVAWAVCVWLLRDKRFSWRVKLLRAILPVGIVLTATAGMMARYNTAVTGRAGTMPYQVYEETYSGAPVLLWQSQRLAAEYRHKVMADFYHGLVQQMFDQQRTMAGYLTIKGCEFTRAAHDLLGFPLIFLIAAAPCVTGHRRTRLATTTVGAALVATAVSVWTQAHYLAPAAPALLLVAVQAIRHLLAASGPERTAKTVLPYALVLSHFLVFGVYGTLHLVTPQSNPVARKAELQAQLEEMPATHLVIVRYRPDHKVPYEWVYNDADVDTSSVVWARSMGERADQRLVEYFRGRRIWLLDADEPSPRLAPYVIETDSQKDSLFVEK